MTIPSQTPAAISPATSAPAAVRVGVSHREMVRTVNNVIAKFPESLRGQSIMSDRFAFHVELIANRIGTDVRVADVGSGWGTVPLACAAIGMKAVIVDDEGDPGHSDDSAVAGMNALYAAYGVERVIQDVVANGFDFPAGSLDAVTSFDFFEHVHNSPRRFAREAVAALRPGGLFIIGVPNCVNLRKRITVPFGFGKWSSMEEWYDIDVFRGHVREPDVDDLRYIARDLGLKNVEIIGRNWKGYYTRFSLVRRLTPLADRLLRLRPSLCSDIYMVGVKAS